jgi:hypothetical protein
MDLMESFRVLRRHRILTVVLLLLTLVGTVGAAVEMPWSYSSKATVVLLNSKNASAATGGNPYLSFASSLTQAADVLCLEVTDPGTGLVLSAHGYPASYQAVVSSATGAPMIQITTTGSNKDAVEHTLQGVTQQVSVKLLALQADVPQQNRITSKLISSDLQASRSTSKKAKPLAVVLGLGLVLTFALPHLLDGMTARRRARRGSDDANSSGYPESSPSGYQESSSGYPEREYADANYADNGVPNHRPRAAEPSPQDGYSPRPWNAQLPNDGGQRWGDSQGRNPQRPQDGRDAPRPANRQGSHGHG